MGEAHRRPRKPWTDEDQRPFDTEKIALWRQENQARLDAYLAANGDPAAEQRERSRTYSKNWRKSNPERFKENSRRWDSVRRRRAKPLLRITNEQKALRFAVFKNTCAYCGEGTGLTIDHVLPLHEGGVDELTNIVPACKSCNCSKQSSAVEQWYRRQPFFTEARWRKIQRHCPAAVAGQLPLALAA